jgi:hypothetical protein
VFPFSIFHPDMGHRLTTRKKLVYQSHSPHSARSSDVLTRLPTYSCPDSFPVRYAFPSRLEEMQPANHTILLLPTPTLGPTKQADNTTTPSMPTTVIINIIGTALTFLGILVTYVECWHSHRRRQRRRNRRHPQRRRQMSSSVEHGSSSELQAIPSNLPAYEIVTGTVTSVCQRCMLLPN